MPVLLNWKEIKLAADGVNSLAKGLRVRRVFVPSRTQLSKGHLSFLSDEWAFELGARTPRYLVFSARKQDPYFYLTSKKQAVATGGTASPFILSLIKNLRDLEVIRISSLDRDRIVVIELEQAWKLFLYLIPSSPYAILTQNDLVRESTRGPKKDPPGTPASSPPKSTAPDLPVRETLFETPEALARWIEKDLARDDFSQRKSLLESLLTQKMRQLKKRQASEAERLRMSQDQPDWRAYGDLLKAHLHALPRPVDGEIPLLDYATETHVRVPYDPEIPPQTQLDRFYERAKKRARTVSEASERMSALSKEWAELQTALGAVQSACTIEELFELQGSLGFREGKTAPTDKLASSHWKGKTFSSSDGARILVGRNATENAQLTFQLARGNDTWLHIRGRPGAHVLISASSGKTPSLETLLDAGILAVHYTLGSRASGAVEVDYTLKKYVRRVPGSKGADVTYSQNKTLRIAPDPERLQRVLSSEKKRQ